MTDDDRTQQWWILSPDDRDVDLGSLLRAVGERNWAVFAGDAQSNIPAVALALSRSADGREVCTGLIVGLDEAYSADTGDGSRREALEVTSRALRSIPVAELIGRAIYAEDAPEHYRHFRRAVVERMPTTQAVRRAPGPRGHPDAHFEMVAKKYREAIRVAPRRPMVWLAEELNADRTTVARWVQRARDRGLLGAAPPGRAGEIPAEDHDD